MFRFANFDIVGGCNAKCPFCVTARTSFGQRIQHIAVADFARSLDRLLELDLLAPNELTIELYSWGEPLLHPNLNAIIRELYNRGLRAGISTNASKKTSFTGPTSHIHQFIFSVPGWSQSSYDKIHNLHFDRVVANIEATLQNLRETGFTGVARLCFHAYKFNVKEELPRAKEWCLKQGINLSVYAAYLNDYEMMLKFRQGTLPRERLDYISENLFVDYVDDTIKAQPEGWECPQFKTLTLNHRSEVLLCCVMPEGHHAYSLGSLFDLSKEQIVRGKTTNKECDTCMAAGIAYWAHHPKIYEHVSPSRSTARKIGRMVRTLLPTGFGAPEKQVSKHL